jgi:hypothetical protein
MSTPIVVQAEVCIKYANLSHVLKEKVEEVALKLNIEFTPSNGWAYKFRKCAEHSYNMKCKV